MSNRLSGPPYSAAALLNPKATAKARVKEQVKSAGTTSEVDGSSTAENLARSPRTHANGNKSPGISSSTGLGQSSTGQAMQPTFVFASPDDTDNIDYNGENMSSEVQQSQNRMFEQMHGVTHRHQPPVKKLKTQHGKENEAVSTACNSGGVVGHWLQEQKRDNFNTGEATKAFVDLVTKPEADIQDPIDVDQLASEKARKKKNVVDLTEDDEVEEIPNTDAEKEVCYGAVQGAQAHAHTIPHPKDHAGITNDGTWWKVLVCTVQREPVLPGSMTIYLRDPHGKSFATVDTRVSRGLAPLMDSKHIKLSIDARLDPRKRHHSEFIGKQVSEYWKLTINLYGPKKNAEMVGKVLSQKNTWLSTPYGVRPGREIYNPHVLDRRAINQQKLIQHRDNGHVVIRTNEEIAQDLSTIFNSLANTDELPELEPSPLIKTNLLHHQKQALKFMTDRETIGDGVLQPTNPLWRAKTYPNGRVTYYNAITGNEQPYAPKPVLGGILADQMGLGKTLEAIAFICSTLEEAKEFARNGDEAVTEDGTKLENVKTTLLVCPKNVTTEWHDQISLHLKSNALKTYFYHGPNRSHDKKFLRSHDVVITTYSIVANELRRGARNNRRSIFAMINWFRIVLDEAHAIREQSTLQSQAICSLYASRRWALTGTPVQNRLEDFGALIKFLRIKPFDEPTAFGQYIMTAFKVKDEAALRKLRVLVDTFTLRRLKDKVSLPARVEEEVMLAFRPDEAALHNWFTKDAGNKMRLMQNQKKHLTGRSYQNVLRSILCLRLVSVHGRELLHEDDLQMISGISSEQPIDLEADEEQATLTARAAYEMLMLMDSANRQVCNRCQKPVRPKEEEDDEENKDAVFGTMLPCYDLLCNACVKVVRTEIAETAVDDRFQCPFCEVHQRISFFELTQRGVEEAELEREQAKLNPRQAKILGRYKGPHTKTYALINAIKANEEETQEQSLDPPIKSVVFTEWTSHLDLLEIAFEELVPHVKFVRFDGKMNVKQQKAALHAFRNDSSVTVILVSIRAGGVGLNLTAASRVYVMEPQWNPAAEQQAVDRVHRLGQKRDVKITRFIMTSSIEETMLSLQGKKKRMAEISMNRNATKGSTSLESMEEFKDLFSRRL